MGVVINQKHDHWAELTLQPGEDITFVGQQGEKAEKVKIWNARKDGIIRLIDNQYMTMINPPTQAESENHPVAKPTRTWHTGNTAIATQDHFIIVNIDPDNDGVIKVSFLAH